MSDPSNPASADSNDDLWEVVESLDVHAPEPGSSDRSLSPRVEQWRALLELEARSVERTVELLGGAQEAKRVALLVRGNVRAAENARSHTAESRRGRRRRRMARVFAWSVAAHVVALGTLWWFTGDRAPSPTGDQQFAARFEPAEESISLYAYRQAELFQSHADGLKVTVPDEALLQIPFDAGTSLTDASSDAVEEADLERLPTGREGFPSVGPKQAGPLAFDHPLRVAPAMFVRRSDELKRRKLQLMGLDGVDTQRAMTRGLTYLRHRQADDGSFPPPKEGSRIHSTSLALLPFLGEGKGSALAEAGADGQRIVKRGIAWIRQRVFDDDKSPSGGESDVLRVAKGLSSTELGCATTALAEDFMLSYGSLSVREVRARSRELQALGMALEAAPQAADRDALTEVWLRLGKNAYARAGFDSPSLAGPTTWLAATSDLQTDASMSEELRAWLRGAVMMRAMSSKSHDKVRSWLAAHAPSWISTIATADSGGVRTNGSGIEQMALTLLALQTAYRGY